MKFLTLFLAAVAVGVALVPPTFPEPVVGACGEVGAKCDVPKQGADTRGITMIQKKNAVSVAELNADNTTKDKLVDRKATQQHVDEAMDRTLHKKASGEPAEPTPDSDDDGAQAVLDEQMLETLDTHNLYRCMHGLEPFQWDEDIAAQAQQWADAGKFRHSPRSARTVNGQTSGENIAWGYPTRSGLATTTAWYNEITFTNNGLVNSINDADPPSEAIGHYTQIVWKDSVKLGCGKGTAHVNGLPGDFWVCQYGPAGNVRGQFSAQVNSPVKSALECGSGASDESTDGPLDYENCVPEDSVGACEKCTHNKQCEGDMFCCPYMKLCVTSSSHGCPAPIARCRPTCHEWQFSDMAACKGNCEHEDFPESWLGTQCPAK